MKLNYKHIEMSSRADGIIEGRATFTFEDHHEMYFVSHVSKSEAEMLVELNRQITSRSKLLDALLSQ